MWQQDSKDTCQAKFVFSEKKCNLVQIDIYIVMDSALDA